MSGNPKCIACGGTGVSSSGRLCYPCSLREAGTKLDQPIFPQAVEKVFKQHDTLLSRLDDETSIIP